MPSTIADVVDTMSNNKCYVLRGFAIFWWRQESKSTSQYILTSVSVELHSGYCSSSVELLNHHAEL